MSHVEWDTSSNRLQRRRRYHLLDGVDSQAGSSKPTVRSDGTTLQTGDRWLDTGDRLWWCWNGTYWLSEQVFWTDGHAFAAISATSFLGGFTVDPAYNLYLRTLRFSAIFGLGTYNTSNFWTARLIRDVEGGSSGTEFSIVPTLQTTIAADEVRAYNSTLNLHMDVSALTINRIRLGALKTGSPPNITGSNLRLTYQLAKP